MSKIRPKNGASDVVRTGDTTNEQGSNVADPRRMLEIPLDALRQTLDTPNRRIQLAWDTRDRLRMKTADDSSARGHYLAVAVEGGALTNERLLELADKWCPGPIPPTAHDLTAKFFSAPIEDLHAVLGEVPVPPPAVTVVRTQSSEDVEKTMALGRSISAALLDNQLNGGLSKNLKTFLGELRGATPAVLGALADAMGTKTSRAFSRTVAKLDTEDVQEMVTFATAEIGRRRSIARASDRGDVMFATRLPRLIEDPTLSPEIAAFLPRSAGLKHVVSGKPLEACQADAVAEAKTAMAAAADVLTEFSPEAIARVDVVGALITPPHVASSTVASGLQPWPMNDRIPHLRERLEEAERHVAADRLLEALGDEPAARPLLGLPKDLRTAAAAELLAHYGTDDPVDAKSKLVAELRSDPLAREDLAEFCSRYSKTAALLAAEEAGRVSQAEELDAGVLRIPLSTFRDAQTHMQRTHPHEGFGYLVTDGTMVSFVSVRNVSETPERHACPDVVELGRVLSVLNSLGLTSVATVHSHPDKSGVFSDEDLSEARGAVAAFPGHRTVIFEVRKQNDTFSTSAASFSSDLTGMVTGEDQLDVVA